MAMLARRAATGGSRRFAVIVAALGFASWSGAASCSATIGHQVGVFDNPLYVTGARDGTGNLYIVERGGRVRLVQPGTQPVGEFLDISSKVATAGNEQGLLGLAFHPAYAANGRLFVYYTRIADGAIVVAEYTRSANATVSATVGREILVVAHPMHTNHNGGMLAFGPDGYLYIGIGDGGAGNDPPNNAQNVDSLLGKILRIDVDRPDPLTGALYSSPPDNPLVGGPGRDEIHAFGFRNPWRFSFDHATGMLWVADVGQAAREEVNAPIVKGGNYGWRVYEGSACTNNDPALCDPTRFVGPLFEYGHDNGRCSITGGYVYRGVRGTLPLGAYVYGDFCTGEVFVFHGGTSSLLLDTTAGLASFGEDDDGELYIVNLAGAVSRLDAAPPASAFRIYEFHHADFDHYFMTGSALELEALDSGRTAGWARTGQFFDVLPSQTGQADVYRYFSRSFAPKSSHFYTPLAQERAAVDRNADWEFEGIAFSAALPDPSGRCAAGTRPLYRLYNDGQGGAPNHRYTTSLDVRAATLARGWIAEGVGALGVIGCVL